MANADLTGLSEDAALIASEGQGAETIEGGRLRYRRISITINKLRKRLIILERRLQ
jgi:hypothetical protein